MARDPESLRDGSVRGMPLGDLYRVNPRARARLTGVFAALGRLTPGMVEAELIATENELLCTDFGPGVPGPDAAFAIAQRLLRSGECSAEEALARVLPAQMEALLRPQPRPRELDGLPVLGLGTGVASGVAWAPVARDGEEASSRGARGRKLILVTESVEAGTIEAVGVGGAILAARCGLVSRAAAEARASGVPVVSGVRGLALGDGWVRLGGQVLGADTWLTVDGSSGVVHLGEARICPRSPPLAVTELLAVARGVCQRHGLSIRVNADRAQEVRAGMRAGARGVGLCRTERMLVGARRLRILQRYVADLRPRGRDRAGLQLLRLYRRELGRLLAASAGEPVTVRLLDPSLGELLPEDESEAASLAAEVASTPAAIMDRARELRGSNPALGLRGCRVGLIWPGIYDLQVQALAEAACDLVRDGVPCRPELLFPMISSEGEAMALRERAERVISSVLSREKQAVTFRFAAMIEVPRAALLAGRIALHVESLCFGTNDLTETTLGLSREDAGRFLPEHVARGLWKADPFTRLDSEGVGELMRLAAAAARMARPDVSLGVCGEHAADPDSIGELVGGKHRGVRIDYLSCSAGRVRLATLAAARALAGCTNALRGA